MNRTGTTRNRPSNASAAVTSHAIKAQVSSATTGKSSQNRNGKARQLHVIGLAIQHRIYAPTALPNNVTTLRHRRAATKRIAAYSFGEDQSSSDGTILG